MPKFKAIASYTVYLELEIEAETKTDAWDIAYNTDGGDFKPTNEYESNWEVNEMMEIK